MKSRKKKQQQEKNRKHAKEPAVSPNSGERPEMAPVPAMADRPVDSSPHPAAEPVLDPPAQTAAVADAASGKLVNEPQYNPEEGAEAQAADEEFLAFKVSGEEYAVDIMAIREIIRPIPITYVPRSPDFINGIISIRGTIVPIFDLTRRLGLKPLAGGKASRIVAVAVGAEMAGFVVDSVTEVVRFTQANIDPPPVTLGEGRAEFIVGVSRYKGRMIVIMDVEKTLSIKDLHSVVPQENR